MTIIGITGGIGHGKSTFAEALAQAEPNSRHLESFVLIAEVVEAWNAQTTAPPNPHDLKQVNNWLQLLPPILQQIVHVNVDPAALQLDLAGITAQPELYDKLFTHLQSLHDNVGLLRENITPSSKPRFRPILQWVGGYMVNKVDPGIWYNELMRRAEQAKAEGVQLCTLTGVRFPKEAEIIHKAGGYIVHIHRPLVGEQDRSDPTERERFRIQPDVTIINDAGLTELVTIAHRMYADMLLGRLKQRYVATDM